MAVRNSKKRRRRYKIHWDRLLAQLILLALIIFVSVWALSFCSSGDDTTDGATPVREAVEAGRRDAEKVLHTAPGSMERDEALLYIKSVEHRLRSSGFGHAADDYITSARSYLDENGIR